MYDTFVTIQGWVGSEVTHRETSQGNVATIRVASTPRIRKRGGEWVDGETTWYSVTCWRSLADNVRDSVRKGDAVIVHGRFRADVWERADGERSTSYVVDAIVVGHDLTRGKSSFVRSTRPNREETDGEADTAYKEMLHQPVGDLPRIDSFGDPVPPDEADSAA